MAEVDNSYVDEDEVSDHEVEDQEEDPEAEFRQLAPKIKWTDKNQSIKNKVVQELIKCFGSMVESHPKEYAVPDHNGRFRTEDLQFEKLLDTSKYVARAKRELLQSENFDTRDFTILIAKKQWAKNILRPLLELCAKNDSLLAMRVCGLALILVRRVSEESMNMLKEASKAARKPSRRNNELDLQDRATARADDQEGLDDGFEAAGSAEGAEGPGGLTRAPRPAQPGERRMLGDAPLPAGVAGATGGKALSPGEDRTDTEGVGGAVAAGTVGANGEAAVGMLNPRVQNVVAQLSALLSFKEAFCTEGCNAAITNAFREFWAKEKVQTTEDNKTQVAICFSYLRRLLAIEAQPQWTTQAQMMLMRAVHHRYIVQLRVLLSVIPGICSDLLKSYHNDWLSDIILIIYYSICSFEAKDLFVVWKADGLIDGFGRHIDKPNQQGAKTAAATAAVSTSASSQRRQNQAVPVPAAVAQNCRQGTMGRGSLTEKLQRERTNRILHCTGPGASSSSAAAVARGGAGTSGAKAQPVLATSRLHGVYRRPLQQLQQSQRSSGGTATSSTHPAGSGAGAGADGRGGGKGGEEGDAPVRPVITQTARLIQDPFDTSLTGAFPKSTTGGGGRKKRHLTFALADTQTESCASQFVAGSDTQQATVVAATLTDMLSSAICLKPLVRRVNEDQRRDEMRVGPELELRYFELIARVMQYNRLKLADEQRRFQQQQEQQQQEQEHKYHVEMKWVPDLVNVMDALDRMSFNRVVTAIERYSSSNNPSAQRLGLGLEHVVLPMALYKEMICYVRLMLESDESGHNELAVSILNPIFFVTTERTDPLLKLLAQWRPGTYSRKHLLTLVELVHETMRTLEACASRYGAFTEDEKAALTKERRSGKHKKKFELDLDQYITAAKRFSAVEYFQRLATDRTVRMYTKLLAHYEQNDAIVTHHIYSFFRRLCTFTLAADKLAAAKDRAEQQAAISRAGRSNEFNRVPVVGGDASYGFLLFNVMTLDVFSTILNDPHVQQVPHMEPLLRLIKSVVRKFGEMSHRNHLLFVEALFSHSRPVDHCRDIDSVYEASNLASVNEVFMLRSSTGKANVDADDDVGSSTDSDKDSSADSQADADSSANKDGVAKDGSTRKHKSKSKRSGSRHNKTVSKSAADGGAESDSEEEFDENNVSAAFAAMRPAKKGKDKGKKAKRGLNGRKGLKLRNKRKRHNAADSDSDSVDNDGDDDDALEREASTAAAGARSRRGGGRLKKKSTFATRSEQRSATSTADTPSSYKRASLASDDEASSGIDLFDSPANSDALLGSVADRTDGQQGSQGRGGGSGGGSGSKKLRRVLGLNSDDDNDDASFPMASPAHAHSSARSGTGTGSSLRRSGRAAAPWSTQEDAVLRQLYRNYAGSNSVYISIANSKALGAFGNNRNEKQVQKRVQLLQLQDMEEDDDDDGSHQEKKNDEKDDIDEDDAILALMDSPLHGGSSSSSSGGGGVDGEAATERQSRQQAVRDGTRSQGLGVNPTGGFPGGLTQSFASQIDSTQITLPTQRDATQLHTQLELGEDASQQHDLWATQPQQPALQEQQQNDYTYFPTQLDVGTQMAGSRATAFTAPTQLDDSDMEMDMRDSPIAVAPGVPGAAAAAGVARDTEKKNAVHNAASESKPSSGVARDRKRRAVMIDSDDEEG